MLAARAVDREQQDELGTYLKEVSQIPLLTADEERVLGERAARGDHASIQRLIRANLRLVIYLARGYAGSGVPLIDLVQEGNQGLMRAAVKFDPSRGVRFASYAGWWIRQSLGRGAAQNTSGVRLPDYMHQRVVSLGRAEGAAPEAVLRAREISRRPASLERLMRNRRFERTLEQRSGEKSGDPFDAAAQEALREAVHRCVSALPERLREVVRMRFGLDGRRARTLTEIGRKLGLSRERVRQIEARALDSIRRTAGRKLESFADN